MKVNYTIITIYKGLRATNKYEDKDDAIQALAEAKERVGKYNAFVVYGTPKEAPKGFRRSGNTLWCPFCRKPRTYDVDPRSKLLSCPVCGISIKNHYVSKMNHLWKAHPMSRDEKGNLVYYVEEVYLRKKRR